MIEQQVYTRISDSKEGGGFGTVAHSKGIPDAELASFESLCSYNVPYRMIDSEHPENNPEVHFLAVKDRYAVIGRSIYRTDEGRSTFLTHNYIADVRSDPSLFRNIPALVAAEGFLSEPPEGSELGSLAAIPAPDIKTTVFDREALFYKNGLTDGIFAALIASLFSAISSSRKLFISLPCATKDIDKNARDVMRLLFSAMPPELRGEMSYTTYFSEGSTNSGIRIYFVDAALLPDEGQITRVGDRSTRYDIIFDLKNSRIQNAQSGRDSMYVSYALRNLCTREANEQIFSDITALFSGLHEALPDADARREFISNIHIYNLIALAESAQQEKNPYHEGHVAVSGGISGLLELFCRLCREGSPASPFAARTLECYARELNSLAESGGGDIPDKKLISCIGELAENSELTSACADVVTAAAALALCESDSAMLRMLSRTKADNDALYVKVMSERLHLNDPLYERYISCCLNEADDYSLLFAFYTRQRLCYVALTEHPRFASLFVKRCSELRSPSNCTVSSLTLVTHGFEREEALADDQMTVTIYNVIAAAILEKMDLRAATPDDYADAAISSAIRINSQDDAEKLACIGVLRELCQAMRGGVAKPDCGDVRRQLSELPVNTAKCEAEVRRALQAMLSAGAYPSDPRAFRLLIYCCDDARDMLGYFAHCPDFLPDFMPYFSDATSSAQRCRSFLTAAVQFYRDHPEATENYRYIFEKYDLARENKAFASAGEPFKDRVLDIYLDRLPPAKRMLASIATRHLRS